MKRKGMKSAVALSALLLTIGGPLTTYAGSLPQVPTSVEVTVNKLTNADPESLEALAATIVNDGNQQEIPEGLKRYNRADYNDENVGFVAYNISSKFSNVKTELTAEKYAEIVEDVAANGEASTWLEGAIEVDANEVDDQGIATLTLPTDGTGVYEAFLIFENIQSENHLVAASQPMILVTPLTNDAGNGFRDTYEIYPKNQMLNITIDLTKFGVPKESRIVDGDHSIKNLLPGAVIALYAGVPGSADAVELEEGITDENGNLTFTGLGFGDYFLVEKESPEGHTLNWRAQNDMHNDFSFTLSADTEQTAAGIEYIENEEILNFEMIGGTKVIRQDYLDSLDAVQPTFNINERIGYSSMFNMPNELHESVLLGESNLFFEFRDYPASQMLDENGDPEFWNLSVDMLVPKGAQNDIPTPAPVEEETEAPIEEEVTEAPVEDETTEAPIEDTETTEEPGLEEPVDTETVNSDVVEEATEEATEDVVDEATEEVTEEVTEEAQEPAAPAGDMEWVTVDPSMYTVTEVGNDEKGAYFSVKFHDEAIYGFINATDIRVNYEMEINNLDGLTLDDTTTIINEYIVGYHGRPDTPEIPTTWDESHKIERKTGNGTPGSDGSDPNDPYVNGGGETPGGPDGGNNNTVTTYGAKFLKQDSGAFGSNFMNQPLAGAEFIILDEQGRVFNFDVNMFEEVDGTNAEAHVVTSGEDGMFEARGLQAGTYFLRELKAPQGYQAITEDIEFTVESDTYTNTMKIIEVNNDRGPDVPLTGSEVLLITSALGMGITGAGFYIGTRKKKQG